MTLVTGMATIAQVGNFKIGMFNRLASHGAPYFKAFLGDGRDQSATVLIESLEIAFIKGLTSRDLAPVIEWAKEHQPELRKNWEEIQKNRSPKPIVGSSPPGLIQVTALPDLVLLCEFDNGEKRVVDFKKIDLLGVLKPLSDQSFFSQVTLVGAFPTWPNGVDLDPDELWEIGKPYRAAASAE